MADHSVTTAQPQVTWLLARVNQGDKSAEEQLFRLVYDDLNRLARLRMSGERHQLTLQATALVHEVFMKLIGDTDGAGKCLNRGHFYSIAAEAMRRILVDRASTSTGCRRRTSAASPAPAARAPSRTSSTGR